MIEQVLPADLAHSEAWRHLDAKLRPFVARRVNEADVTDVLQDVYVRIQRGLPSLREDERLGPWIYRIARSVVIDHHRSRKKLPLPSGEGPEPTTEGNTAETDEESVQREVALYAVAFVALLPSPYREAITLTEVEQLTQKEAAQMLNVSLSTMKSRVQRGRQKLRQALEECCTIALDARHRVIACEPRPDGKMPPGCCEPQSE